MGKSSQVSESDLIKLWEKPFRTACCNLSQDAFVSLDHYHNALFNWIIFAENIPCDYDITQNIDYLKLSRICSAVKRHRPDREDKTLFLSAGWEDPNLSDRFLVGCSLARFPTRELVAQHLGRISIDPIVKISGVVSAKNKNFLD